MKPMPEKTTSDSFPTAPRATPGKVLTAYLLNNWETNRRLQILLATFSSPSLSEPSARGPLTATLQTAEFFLLSHYSHAPGSALPLNFMRSAGQGSTSLDSLDHGWE